MCPDCFLPSFLPASLHLSLPVLLPSPSLFTLYKQPPEECTAECGDTRVTEVTGADDTMIVTAVYDQCSMALGSCSLQYFIGVGENTIYVVKTPQGMDPSGSLQ